MTVQQNYGGDVIPVPSPTARYSIGDQLWFTALPWFGWEVDYWEQRWASDWMPPDALNGNSAMIQVRGDNIVACVFKRQDPNQRILNISSIGPGNVNPAAGSYSYAFNSQVTVTATPSQNTTFVGWSLNGANIGSNTTTVVTMSGDLDQTLIASFTSTNLIQYTNDAPDIADTYIYEDAPTAMGRDVGSDSDLWVWYPQSGHIWDSLLKFDLSGISSNAIISSVSLRLWFLQYPNTCASLEVQKVLQDWPESNCNFVPQRTYTVWSTEPRYSYTGWMEIDLSSLHSEWINWVQNEWLQPSQNHGLLVRIVQEWINDGRQSFNNNGPWRFSSREGSDPTENPVLRVVYLAPKPIPTIATDQTNIVMQIAEGQVPTNQTLQIYNSGQGILNYAVSNNASWISLSGEITGTSSNENHRVTLNFNTAGLAAINYQAAITITDTNANNSPYTVPVLLTVLGPTISVSTTNISAATLQGSNAAPTTIEIWNGGFSALAFSLVETSAWLNVTPTSGTSTGDVQQITVQFASASLAPGIYQDTLIVTNTTGDTPSVSIPVTLTVFDEVATPIFNPGGNTVYLTNVSVSISCATLGATIYYTLDGFPPTQSSLVYAGLILLTNTTILRANAWNSGMLPSQEQIATFEVLPPTVATQPVISVQPTSLTNTVTQGQNAQSETFQVWNSGTNILSYSISTNVSWLAVSPAAGTSSGGTNTHTVVYSTTSLTSGVYIATITITSTNAINSPQAIPVMFTVIPTNSSPTLTNTVYLLQSPFNPQTQDVVLASGNGIHNLEEAAQSAEVFNGKIYYAIRTDGSSLPSKIYCFDPASSNNVAVLNETNDDFWALKAMNNALWVSHINGNLWESTDGVNFTEIVGTPFASTNYVTAMAEFDGQMYFATSSGNIYASSDGSAFTLQTTITAGNPIDTLTAWNGCIYVADTEYYSYTAKIFQSADGTNWTILNTNHTYEFFGLVPTANYLYLASMEMLAASLAAEDGRRHKLDRILLHRFGRQAG